MPSFPKSNPLRSEPYRRYVASKDCFACGISGFSQAAHGNVGKGMALKVCDRRLFPLCGPHFGLPGCHMQFDLCIDMTRAERRWKEAVYIDRMQAMARADGRPEFREAA